MTIKWTKAFFFWRNWLLTAEGYRPTWDLLLEDVQCVNVLSFSETENKGNESVRYAAVWKFICVDLLSWMTEMNESMLKSSLAHRWISLMYRVNVLVKTCIILIDLHETIKEKVDSYSEKNPTLRCWCVCQVLHLYCTSGLNGLPSKSHIVAYNLSYSCLVPQWHILLCHRSISCFPDPSC